MGYERSFVPAEEAIEEFRRNVSHLSDACDNFKIELKTYCMLDHSEDKMSDVLFKIKYYLNGIRYDTRSECYRIAVEQYEEHGSVWFCGWEHAHEAPDCDYNDVFRYAMEKLVILACVVKTPDWFDESEKFYEKLNEIDSVIEYFCDEVTTVIDYEIMDKLKDYEEKDEADEETEGELHNSGDALKSRPFPFVTTYNIKVCEPSDASWTTTSSDLNKEHCQPTESKE